ncbi:MAG: phosphatase PAP2 family protein [Flavobacteriales bacterium]|nr:phosphatase PAP2 family protein [Flavobacteriales bacterium]
MIVHRYLRSSLALLVALLVACPPSMAQEQKQEQDSPYDLNWKRDAIYASGALVFTGIGYFTRKQVTGHTEQTLLGLDRYDVPGFDRSTVDNWRPSVATASDYMMYASAAMPLLMMADRRARQDWLGLAMMYIEVGGFTIGLTELTKGMVRRPRPYAYNTDVPLEERMAPDARLSFFSGHTSTTAAMCFLTAKVFSDYSDNRVAEGLVWTGAVIAPAVVGFLRVHSGKHFPSDVITGYLVGATIGYLVPELHRKKHLPKGMTVSPFGSQYGAGLHFSYSL